MRLIFMSMTSVFFLASCGSIISSPDSVSGQTPFVALPYDMGTQKVVKAGEDVIRQDVHYLSTARLLEPYLFTDKKMTEVFPAGTELFQITYWADDFYAAHPEDNGPGTSRREAYCGVWDRESAFEKIFMGSAYSGDTLMCLSDRDGDGAFETVQAGVGATQDPPTIYEIYKDGTTVSPVKYEITAGENRPADAGIWMEIAEGFMMKPGIRTYFGTAEEKIELSSLHQFDPEALPADIDLLGVRFHILARDDEGYRISIEKTFPVSEVFSITKTVSSPTDMGPLHVSREKRNPQVAN